MREARKKKPEKARGPQRCRQSAFICSLNRLIIARGATRIHTHRQGGKPGCRHTTVLTCVAFVHSARALTCRASHDQPLQHDAVLAQLYKQAKTEKQGTSNEKEQQQQQLCMKTETTTRVLNEKQQQLVQANEKQQTEQTSQMRNSDSSSRCSLERHPKRLNNNNSSCCSTSRHRKCGNATATATDCSINTCVGHTHILISAVGLVHVLEQHEPHSRHAGSEGDLITGRQLHTDTHQAFDLRPS